jgi:ABC-type methionine transport system permease subunit
MGEPRKAPDASPMSTVLRSPDVLLVVIAFYPAMVAGASFIGYALGGGGWILQRLVAVMDRRLIAKAADPIRQLTLNLFEAFGRIWLLAGVIVLAAVLGERQDGLTAAVVILVAYSVAFVIRLRTGARRPGAAK